MRRVAIALLAGALLAGLATGSAVGAAIMDQHQTNHNESITGPKRVGQTFTVGINGKLTTTTMMLSCSSASNVTVWLQGYVSSTQQPDASSLTRSVVSVHNSAAYYLPFEFSVPVTAGEHLSLVVELPAACAVEAYGVDAYAGGRLWTDYQNGTGWKTASGDAYFITWVEPDPATPTPGKIGPIGPIATLIEPPVLPTGAIVPSSGPATQATATVAATATASETGSAESSASVPPASSVGASPGVSAGPAASAKAPASSAGGSDSAPLLLLLLIAVVAAAATGLGGFLLGRRKSIHSGADEQGPGASPGSP